MTNGPVADRVPRPQDGGPFRLGLRWGLNVAFAGVASLTLVASIVAFFSYMHIRTSLERVEDDAIPAVTDAMAVARETAELSAISARVLAVKTDKQLDAVTTALEPEEAAMRAALQTFAQTSIGSSSAAELSKGIEEMLASTRELAASVRQRLQDRASCNALVARASSAHREVIEKLAPMLDDAKFNIAMGLEGLAGLPSRDAVLNALDSLDLGQAGKAEILSELRAETNQAFAILAQTAVTSDKDLLLPANERFIVAKARILKLAAKLDHGAASGDLGRALDKFLSFGDPDTGLVAAQRRELLSAAQGAALVGVNQEKVARLADEVDNAVQLARWTSAKAVAASRDAIKRSESILLALVAFNLLTAAAIAYFFVEKGVVRPLTVLKDAALGVASGDFGVWVPYCGQSEIGRMGAAIEVFKQNGLRARDLDVERSKRLAAEAGRREKIETYIAAFDTSGQELSKALAAASIEMDTTARAMTVSAQEVGQEVANVNAAAGQAADCVHRAADAAEEISRNIEDIRTKIGESSDISLRAVDEAKRADSTMRGMVQLATRIGEVVGLIRQVANQTNLLALNATIEAARAGEAGRGFAVVAGEVKDLATQTEKATQDISLQVTAIQATAEDAVAAIQTIDATIEKMNAIAAAIVAAMAQQSVATREIAHAVHVAADSANQVNLSIQTVDQGVAGTGTAACRVLAAAADLGERSQALQREIGQFLGQIRTA